MSQYLQATRTREGGTVSGLVVREKYGRFFIRGYCFNAETGYKIFTRWRISDGCLWISPHFYDESPNATHPYDLVLE